MLPALMVVYSMAKDMPVSKQLLWYACRCLLASVPSNLDHCVAGWGKVYKKDGLLCDSVLVQWQGQYLRPSGKSQMYEVNAYSQIRTNATRDGERGGQHVRAWQIAREGTKDQDADTYATGRGRRSTNAVQIQEYAILRRRYTVVGALVLMHKVTIYPWL